MRRDVRFVECGYVTPEAMREARGLGRRTRILLAAAALTYRDSEWSDRGRDLTRAVDEARGTTDAEEVPEDE